MANYNNLSDAIAAEERNMTVLRNNVQNTSSSRTTYATGITWFKYNNVVVSNVYSSGYSDIAIGQNSTSYRICVNRRSGAVYYEYYETGLIGKVQFYKFTWDGYDHGSRVTPEYKQTWDLFFFDTGHIFLYFRNVPTSNFTGTNTLSCSSSNVITYYPSVNSREFTFTPGDVAQGKNWTVTTGRPPLWYYASPGYIEYVVNGLDNLSNIVSSKITWIENVPEGTSVDVQAKLDSGSYQSCTNGGHLPVEFPQDLSNSTLYIKVTLETELAHVTPLVYDISILIYDQSSANLILLAFDPGSKESFRNAIGQIIVHYDGTGGLSGEGGPVEPFDIGFFPEDLIEKPDQHETEHISMSFSAQAILIRVTYYYRYDNEHINLSFVASGSLIHVDDL